MMSTALTMSPHSDYVIVQPTTEGAPSLSGDAIGNATGYDALYDVAEHVITQYVFGVMFIGGVLGNIVTFVVLQHDEFRQASMRFTLSALALVDTGLLVFGLLRQWLWEVLGRDPQRR